MRGEGTRDDQGEDTRGITESRPDETRPEDIRIQQTRGVTEHCACHSCQKFCHLWEI